MKTRNLRKTINHFLFILIFIAIFIGIPSSSANGAPLKNNLEIDLWNGIAPGTERVTIKETITESNDGPGLLSRNISGITKPALTPFIPAKPNGTAVLVLPGGGLTKVVFDKEGVDIAKWLNSIGITAFVLKYRLPGEGHLPAKYENVAFQDTQRALRLIRYNAGEWQLNPEQIGVIGFSAGGRLAATLGIAYQAESYQPIDDIDKVSARPDFMVLVYGTKYWRQITKDTPKTFIVIGDSDQQDRIEGSLYFYGTLRRVGVPAELHVFTNAAHGFAIRKATGGVARWTELCAEWLKEIGALR